jgi:flagella basal body P-ring formation protein FlgA
MSFLGVMLCSAPVYGQEMQELSTIKAAAKNFLIEQLSSANGRPEITIGNLDPRLKLPRCNMPLRSFNPPGSQLIGNTTVGVSCEDQKPWKLYIGAKVRLFTEIIVSNRYLGRGTTLDKSDIKTEERDVSVLSRGYISNPVQAIGKVLKQPVKNSGVITPDLLDKPLLVKNGEQVIILAKNNGIEVRMKGKALTNGSVGDLVRIRNINSRRIVEARVISEGLVNVPM